MDFRCFVIVFQVIGNKSVGVFYAVHKLNAPEPSLVNELLKRLFLAYIAYVI